MLEDSYLSSAISALLDCFLITINIFGPVMLHGRLRGSHLLKGALVPVVGGALRGSKLALQRGLGLGGFLYQACVCAHLLATRMMSGRGRQQGLVAFSGDFGSGV